MAQQEVNHEPIIMNDEVSTGKYDDKEVIGYIVQSRNNDMTFDQIASGLQNRGYSNIDANTVSKLWKRAIAKTVTSKPEAKKAFDDHTATLKDMYGKSLELMGIYVKRLRELIDQLDNTEEDSLLAKAQIIKTIPIAVGLMREIRGSVETQISIQDTISKTAQEDVVWNSGQMIQYINEHLKLLEENGQIKILDPMLK